MVDTYGHCVLCGKNMLIKQVIDGKVQERFTPDYTEAQFLLNDKSKMNVAMCQGCKNNITDEQHTDIMQSVISGWQVQVDNSDWTDEKKQAHMEKYSQLEIVSNSEDIPPDVLDNKFNTYLNSKAEPIKGVIDGVD